MRAILGLSFALVFSASVLLAQSTAEATAGSDESKATTESAVNAEQQPTKAINVDQERHVTVGKHEGTAKAVSIQKTQDAKEAVQYDEKGGIIVPNASKGIQQSTLSAKQKAIHDKVKGIKSAQQPAKKDLEAKKQSAPQKKNEGSGQKK